ncbi:hypothetical protein DL765_011338 [Monosporascus sp. GIB2]|nr:hypothetical protein DL765_011338 [Monosporascus sp. GIB2]
MSFVPKQAYPPNADLYEEIVGDSTSYIAEKFLELTQPLPPYAIIHDNGCGGGQVIEKIMGTQPPPTIQIEATDIDPTQISNCTRAAAAAGWPVRVTEMAAESLDFADNTFTHSFSNLLLFATRNTGVDAAKEIYRTLKPGGIAVATWFSSIPHQEIIKEVHYELRGPDIPLPHGMPDAWYNSGYLRSVVEQGGFQPEKIQMFTVDTFCNIPDLRRWVTILWSYIGCPANGWAPADEERWDEAISTVIRRLEESPAYENKNKGGVLSMKVNICIATK